jgi:hypothetical protein
MPLNYYFYQNWAKKCEKRGCFNISFYLWYRTIIVGTATYMDRERRYVYKSLLLRTAPWRRMGEWVYRSTFSWHRHYLGLNSQLHAPPALPARRESPVHTGKEAEWVPESVWMTCPYRDWNFDTSAFQSVTSRIPAAPFQPLYAYDIEDKCSFVVIDL